jgi:hypothetical protein
LGGIDNLAVLMDGDKDVNVEVLRRKDECLLLGGYQKAQQTFHSFLIWL